MSLAEYRADTVTRPRSTGAPVDAVSRGRKRPIPEPRPRGRATAPHLAAAERLARHFIAQLEAGEHAFSALRADFSEWCAEAGIDAVSDVALAGWLREAGCAKHRAGRRKLTVYTKSAARFAARFAA